MSETFCFLLICTFCLNSCIHITTTSGLGKNQNLSLSFGQPALQFYLPEAMLSLPKVQSMVKQAMKFLTALSRWESERWNLLAWQEHVLVSDHWTWFLSSPEHYTGCDVNPRWWRCATRITTWCTKIAPPFALIGSFLQLQAQNNADRSPKKPKGSRKMMGRRKNDRAPNKTTGHCALSFRPS